MKKFMFFRLLFLFLFALGSNINVLAIGDDNGDIIPDYTIEAPWPTDFGSSENGSKDVPVDNNPGNNANNNSGSDDSEDKISENDLREINNLNLTEEDYGDEEGLIAKIKSKLPNIKISKKLVKKIVKTALIVGAAGVISYAAYKAYKLVTYAAKTIKSAVGAVGIVSKSAAILGLCVLFLKYAAGHSDTDQY